MQSGLNNNDEIVKIGNTFVDPVKIIRSIGMKPGDKVADFGCGPGYFSIPIAKYVGEEGDVYAFDVLPSALEALESRAKMLGIDNIKIRRVNLENNKSSGLKEESVDWVILKNILFQNDKKRNIIKEAYRVLKRGGRILIMEWGNNLSVGPKKEKRISPQKLIEIINNEEFIFEKQIPAGDYHYIILAGKL